METLDMEAVSESILDLTPANWMLIRKTFDMTREEILEDSSLLMILGLWKSGETTQKRLVELLNTPERELYKAFGVDVDAELEKARAESASV